MQHFSADTLSKKRYISVRNARVHNLKGISVDIPRNSLVVVSGVSGSGKSSLAFDTLYAEGQRRFVESLSSYVRQFLERLAKPDVESISGLPPAVAIEQRTLVRNPRSTVGTVTEIYDYLRLLYGRVGTTICKCGKEVRKDNAENATASLGASAPDARVVVSFPMVVEKGVVPEEIDRYRSAGFTKLFDTENHVTLEIEELESVRSLDPKTVYIVADRLRIASDKDSQTRLFEALETSFNSGAGRVLVYDTDSGRSFHFSNVYECADCRIVYQEPEPRLFSFNSPFGACPTCQGFGRSVGIDADLVVPDKMRSIKNAAIAPFRTPGFTDQQMELLRECARARVPIDIPYGNLSQEHRDFLWNGDAKYKGINGFFATIEAAAQQKVHFRVLLSRFRGYTTCTACNGSRLRTSARRVFVEGVSLPSIVAMTLEEATNHFAHLELGDAKLLVINEVLREIRNRLSILVDIGLGYLTLDRLSHTLSGGESQRINLASSLGSSLVGTLYVLDEPSIGLHSRDTQRLVDTLKKLRSKGNTVVVVEHDLDIIRQADHVIDIGPAAGERGGELMHSGTVEELVINERSVTGKYLAGKDIAAPQRRPYPSFEKTISVVKAVDRNLKTIDVTFPLNCICAVTGVSGSGKSTLVRDVLFANYKRSTGGYSGHVGFCESIEGSANIVSMEMIDQTPIGRSSRSTPVTYTKAYDAIRDLFADLPSAKQMGWQPGHFSFNVPGGRCETCEGEGYTTVEMQFLPDVRLTCESCRGSRFRKESRLIEFRGKSIVDVLEMTIDDAIRHFHGVSKVVDRLRVLADVGLGYLRLGQSSTMLSGGEAQRIKLATNIEDAASHGMLFIFDEPTTGLHLDDIAKLIACFDRLVESGHSVILVEHNLHVIASCDYVIDIGPEAGARGGQVVAKGSPQEVAESGTHTGQALRTYYAGVGRQ